MEAGWGVAAGWGVERVVEGEAGREAGCMQEGSREHGSTSAEPSVVADRINAYK